MARGLSQAQLARRLGLTFHQVEKYGVGSNRIGIGRLVQIATILGVPAAALLEGTVGTDPAGSLLALIDDRRSFRFAHAFAAIEERTARLSIVNLVEKIAATVPQPKRSR
jgi:transcriptional regulator with XRE-family HTH domain